MRPCWLPTEFQNRKNELEKSVAKSLTAIILQPKNAKIENNRKNKICCWNLFLLLLQPKPTVFCLIFRLWILPILQANQLFVKMFFQPKNTKSVFRLWHSVIGYHFSVLFWSLENTSTSYCTGQGSLTFWENWPIKIN